MNRARNMGANLGMALYAFCQGVGSDEKEMCVIAMMESNNSTYCDAIRIIWDVILTIYLWSMLLESVFWCREDSVGLLIADIIQLVMNVIIGVLPNVSLNSRLACSTLVILTRVISEGYELYEFYQEVDFVWVPHFHPCGEQMDSKTIMMIGNPGVGKSTLLNGIANGGSFWSWWSPQPKFESGRSLGKGLTDILQREVLNNGITLMDSPGLNDEENVKKASEEIGNGLKSTGHFKIFFTITLLHGRVKPEDFVTIRCVLKAAAQICDYGIIVNFASKEDVKDFHKGNLEKCIYDTLDRIVYNDLSDYSRKSHRPHVTVVEKVKWLENATGSAIPNLPRRLKKFIDKLPAVTITPDKVSAIKYKEALEEMSKEVLKLREEVERLKRVNIKKVVEEIKESARNGCVVS